MNRIFIIGDTHGSIETFEKIKLHYHDLTKNDYVIVAGDFGFIWGVTEAQIKDEERWLGFISMYPWTTLFIDGNHENFSRLNSYPVISWHGGRVHKIRDDIFHLMRGEIFDIGDKKFFCFGGAYSVDKAYRTPYKSWWPEEIPSQDEYENAIENLKKIDYKPDYIITHAMPDFFIRELYGGRYIGGDKAARMLNDFLLQCVFKKWYCGHYHFDVKVRDNLQICFKKIYEIKPKE